MAPETHRFWNPYLAGAALGAVLTTTFLLTGHGLGASGASLRAGVAAFAAVAPAHVARTPALARAAHSSHSTWLLYEIGGLLLGGLVAARTAGRARVEIVRGPRMGAGARLVLALGGGVLMGVGARMARGCTSGQALSGGALLSAGSWVFMGCVFGGGYAVASLVRRAWR